MKAEDLMVRDWIRLDFTTASGVRTVKDTRIQQIIIPYEEYHEYYIKGDNLAMVSLKYAEPIPLTPEILEKNGFIEDKSDDTRSTFHLLIPTSFEKNSYTVQVTLYKQPICGVQVLFKCWGWIPPHNGGLDDIHLCSLAYVHQMQHALRLCGIEKEIII